MRLSIAGRITRLLGGPLFLCVAGAAAAAQPLSSSAPTLSLEAVIPIGTINGRIDHLAVDLGRQRLFVAELGNNSIGVVDLEGGRLLRTLEGFSEPQGIAYVASTDAIYVANGADGTVRVLRADDYAPLGRIALGADADNVRVAANSRRVFVGYGDGAIAVIDPATMTRIDNLPLKGHPESFRLVADGQRIVVNVPDAREIAVLDGTTRRQIQSWRPPQLAGNFPLVVDAKNQRVLVVYRNPATLAVFDIADGTLLARINTCGDADDLFLDEHRSRIYVTCGEGVVETIGVQAGDYVRIGRVATSPGARTSLYVPELDRLFVAVRASGTKPAAIWVLRPSP